MPGLIGFTDKHQKYNDTILFNMRSLLRHFDSYVDEKLYSDKTIYVSRTHLGIINQGRQPYCYKKRFLSWMEGEFYNQEELKSKYDVVSEIDNELLIKIYHSTKSFEFLRDIDGHFIAVLYDKEENKIHLITDRFGFKPLYWGLINDNLVWSSELKGFLGHINFVPKINQKAVVDFFDIGYQLENSTWFKGIELVPPASVLTYNILESRKIIQYYWSWSEIIPMNETIDEMELIEELGRLFIQSVRKRISINERMGITLSGGLDSRAILAAFPEDYKPIHTFTFGKKDCDDIKIANKVSSIKGATHHILELSSHNWLTPRISGIWKSDASFSILHMHGVEFYTKYKSYMDFNLNGILGDASIGGLYVNLIPNNSEGYIARNRGRRFINQALVLGEAWLIHRRPFTGKDLVEFVFSIPENLRKDSYIYNKMLLKIFPKYFNNIPWQKTGCPISYSKGQLKLIEFKNRVINRLRHNSQRLGPAYRDLKSYHNYPEWIRKEPAKSFFGNILLSKNSLYPEYIDRSRIQTYIKDHIEGKANYHNELCLALTFEIWLKQIFEKGYRINQ